MQRERGTIASDRELDALAGNADVERPDAYRRNARSRIRDRIERLEHELDRLTEVEPELADALRVRVCTRDDEIADQMREVQREMQELARMLAERDSERGIPHSVLADLLAADDESIDIDQLREELQDAADASGDGGDT